MSAQVKAVSKLLGVGTKDKPTTDVEGSENIDSGARIDLHTGGIIAAKSPAERRFVARLDAIVLPYLCVSQVIKFLDQQNISAAYVSGMKEELDVKGVEYNLFSTFFFIGYAICLIPSQIVITMVRPSYWLPSLEFAWGILTLAAFKAQNVQTLYALRFLIGCFESSCYPGAIMILMSWYTPRELGFRIGLYTSCQFLGSMLAGALQAAIYTGMSGHHGISGWRWMFVVNGIMTVIVALLGYVFIPDYPSKPNPLSRFWLKPEHVNTARLRSAKFRRVDNKPFTRAGIVRTFKEPLIYMIAIIYPATVLAQQGYNYFNLFLKSLTRPDGSPLWSVAAVNAIPIGGNAITVVMLWIYSFISDYFQSRWAPLLVQCVIGLVPSSIMIAWNVPLGVKYFAFFACYLSVATSPPIFAWVSDLCPHDPEQRAFIVGFSIALWYALGAWCNVLIWPTYEVPHYSVAWQVCLGVWFVAIFGVLGLRVLEIRYFRPRNNRRAQELYEETHTGQAALGLQDDAIYSEDNSVKPTEGDALGDNGNDSKELESTTVTLAHRQ